MQDAGFADSQEVTHEATIMGRIVYYKAVRPPSSLSAAG
jgi:hypothetical protein